MKTRLVAVLLLASASAFAAPRVFVGVGGYRPVYHYRGYVPSPVVAYAAPVPVAPAYYGPEYYGPAYYAPPVPVAGSVWIGGWGGRPGYWSRRAFVGARVAPRYYGGRYYGGHWRR
jgi:hypothetical protein